MAFSHPLHGHPDATALRKEAGEYLKQLRLKADVKQQELANKVGMTYYTMVSQVESGKTRLPPDKLLLWADALGVDRAVFAKQLLYFYDPFTFQAIFGTPGKKAKAK